MDIARTNNVIETDKTYAGKSISYEVNNDAKSYLILLGGDPWISQEESGYIPFKVTKENGEVDLEASCIAHIEDITKPVTEVNTQ